MQKIAMDFKTMFSVSFRIAEHKIINIFTVIITKNITRHMRVREARRCSVSECILALNNY